MKKQFLFSALHNVGVSSLLRSQKKNRITVLSLHRISDEPDFFWNPIRPNSFERLLQYLQEHYTIICFRDIAENLDRPTPAKPLLILSFDDGYYDFYEHALPIILKLGVNANHNIVNACAGEQQVIWTQRLNTLFSHCMNQGKELSFSHERESWKLSDFQGNWMHFYLHSYRVFCRIPYTERLSMIEEKEQMFNISTKARMMNWEEVIHCARQGIEIGSHTYHHDVLSTITDRDILINEIVRSKTELESRIGMPVTVLALPNGQAHADIDEIAALAGFSHILYVGEKVNEMEKYQAAGPVHNFRINLVEESLPEMILRTEMFHAKLKRHA